jgi:hypothetical protein
VNENHLRMLASPRWAEVLRTHVLPWVEGDQFVPVDPDGMPERLSAIGFTGIAVAHGEFDFRFKRANPGKRAPSVTRPAGGRFSKRP